MNWNYGTLEPCSNFEKNNQVPFPNNGANCRNDSPTTLVQKDSQKRVPWGSDMNWNYDTLPPCSGFERWN